MTVARSVGQLPMFYDRKPGAHRGYLFDSKEPVFPFGFGLPYTTFEIGLARLSATQIKADQPVSVMVDVMNTGKVGGDEVVQLYLHHLVSSVTLPVKELEGFRRVRLAPGEHTTVQFTLDWAALSFWDAHMKRTVEPGAIEITAGANSVDLKRTTLEVVR